MTLASDHGHAVMRARVGQFEDRITPRNTVGRAGIFEIYHVARSEKILERKFNRHGQDPNWQSGG